MRSSLRPRHLSLKVPFFEVHFIQLVIWNIPTETTATAFGIVPRPIPVILETLGLLTSSDGALVAPLRLLFSVRLWHLLALRVLVTVAALPLPLLLIALAQKLVLLDFVNRVVTILLHLLSGRPVWLIIFNQNCLSCIHPSSSIITSVLIICSRLICCFCLRRCSLVLLHGSFVLSLLRLATRGLLLAGRICLDVVLARVAYVELFVRAVPLDFCDEQSLVDVFVPKVCACRIINVFFIVVIEIDALVIYEVFRLLVWCFGTGIVLRIRGSPGLRIVLLNEFDLYFVDMTASIWFLI